jgi:ABC-type oligopeptide transport system substrate-binding subunit
LLHDIAGARAFQEGRATRGEVGVRVVDDHTLEVTLERPAAYFLHLLAFTVARPIPAHLAEVDSNWAEPERIVTCGPFRLSRWESGERLTLRRAPQYSGRSRGNVEQIELMLSRHPDTVAGEYAAERLDVVWLRSHDQAQRVRARRRHGVDYVSIPALITQFVGFNATRAPFSDRRVRQALAMSVDKEYLAEIAMGGDAVPAAGGLLPHAMPGHSPGIGQVHDVARARTLLAEAGYPGGSGFPALDAVRLGPATIVADFLTEQWQTLGITVTWQPAAFTDDLIGRRDVVVAVWAADYPDPDSFLRLYLSRYIENKPDHPFRLLIEAARTETETRRRLAMYQEADRLLVEEAYCLPLVYDRLQFLIRPWVRHYPTSPQCWWFWKDVVIEPHGDDDKQRHGGTL